MAIEPIKGFYVHDEETDTDGVAKYDYESLAGIEPVEAKLDGAIDEIDVIDGLLDPFVENVTPTVELEVNSVHGYYNKNGVFTEETSIRRNAIVEPVSTGEKYYLTTHTGSTLIPAILYYNGETFLSYDLAGNGTQQDITDYEFTIPENCTKLIVQCSDQASAFGLKKSVTELSIYTKEETNSKMSEAGRQRYGVKWEMSNPDDLGQRCFSAVGLTATIGVGSTNGNSDFDNIYPWSEIKRCNIKQNANGAEVVTFEGETGFSLDGSNGDVFVYIPKFYYERYQTGGYEYRVISAIGTNPHPAFVEDGKELDALYIGAFEGKIDAGGKLRSIGNVLPTNNTTAPDFLSAAQANGGNYSLYDNRCVDAVWSLFAVEYGCRNTNRVLGYGYSDFEQPATYLERDKIVLAATNTNTVRTIKWGASYKNYMPVGSNITVCGNNNQRTILTQAKITACVDSGDYTDWTFDGDPIDVDTTCFIGSAACNTNFCETVPSGALNWHTGRADWQTGSYATRRNPVRYRWIENIFGNLWHFLPDVTFYNLQMYVCNNMKDYEFGKHADEYKPENAIYTEQSSNGRKDDLTGYNSWVTDMDNGQFTKGIDFGRTFSQNLTSEKAFGAYYYLYATSNTPIVINNGGGFDHLWRCNILTQRAWGGIDAMWYLYGARLMYKHID